MRGRAAHLRLRVLRRLLHQEVQGRADGEVLDPLPRGAEGERLRSPPPGTSAPCPSTEGPALLGGRAPNVPPWQVPIPTTPGLDPLSLLTDAADVAAWSNQGLPSDRTSTENATILCNTQRWPLVVDAQLQGIKWIKNKYGGELKAIRLGQRRWVGGAGCPPPVPYRLCTPIRAKAPESNRGQGVLQGLAGGHLPKLTTSPPLPARLQLPGHHRAGGF